MMILKSKSEIINMLPNLFGQTHLEHIYEDGHAYLFMLLLPAINMWSDKP